MDNEFAASNEYVTIIPPVYLMQAKYMCYDCEAIIDVYCLAANHYIERKYLIYEDTGEYQTIKEKHKNFVRFSNLKHASKNILSIIEKETPFYRLAYTSGRDEIYYVNHCSSCDKRQGDYYLHDIPQGAFYPTTFKKFKEIKINDLGIKKPANVVADLNLIEHDDWKKMHISQYDYIEENSNYIQSPHDKYFRAMLTNKKVAIDFLEWHLPESIKEIVDLNTIEVKKDTFVDDNFKKLESDVLFSVKFNADTHPCLKTGGSKNKIINFL